MILWKPFDRQFKEVIDNFHKHKTSVERQAHLSHMIEAAGERGAQSDERMLAEIHRGAEIAMQRGRILFFNTTLFQRRN